MSILEEIRRQVAACEAETSVEGDLDGIKYTARKLHPSSGRFAAHFDLADASQADDFVAKLGQIGLMVYQRGEGYVAAIERPQL